MRKSKFSAILKYSLYIAIFFVLFSNAAGQTNRNALNDYTTTVEFRVENDFVFKTDIYFTNGLFLQIFAPFANKNPLNTLLIPFGQNAKVYHGISLIQNIYTPIEKSDSIIVTDRPFSAYLLLQNTRIALYKTERQKVVSTLKLGVIGPPALGEEMQNGIHSLLPTSSRISGWQNQIKFDIMFNYFAAYEKGMLNTSLFDIDYLAFANIGQPYTNFGIGLNFRVGKFNNYFENFETSKQNKLQYYISVTPKIKYVVYDATLQGGFFNRASVLTIAAANIKRFVGNTSIFGNLSYNNFKIKIGMVFLTREFGPGISDKWGALSILFGF